MLLWMLPAVFFLGLTSVVSQYLNAVGIPRRSIELWFGAMLLQCALGAWLVPRYGGIGAAATLSVVHTTNFVLQGALACHVAKKRVMAPRDILPDASSQPPFPRAAA
jgi:O-antigen/teichoic acid export membrane protein